MTRDAKSKKLHREPVRPGRRRMTAIAMTIALSLAIWLAFDSLEHQLVRTAWFSGYLMLGMLLFLAAFNARKKLPGVAFLGNASTWMQLHIHVAFLSLTVFLVHTGFHFPSGRLEGILAGLYGLVFASGVYGLFVTRATPRKLSATGFEVIFEQIPARRTTLAIRARELVLDTAKSTDVLARFYMSKLARFMELPRSLAYNVSPSLRQSRLLMAELYELDRYLAPEQRIASRRLSALVREKEDLDYHWALQGRLKLWLFVHIGLTYGLLIIAVLHGVIAHAFGGGLR